MYIGSVKKKIRTCFLLFLLTTTLCIGETKTIVLGREDGWRDLRRIERVVLQSGKHGYYDIALADGSYEPSSETDLLLHFDGIPVRDATGTYRADVFNAEIHRQAARFGDGGAVFRGETEGLVLKPSTGAAFSSNRVWSDLTMEFWLYPAILDDGATLFEWRGSDLREDGSIIKSVRIGIRNRSLVWSFENFFTRDDTPVRYFEMKSPEKLVPRKWHHHLLRYESGTGLIEYLRDGRIVGITHATPSGHEESTVFSAFTGNGSQNRLLIGNGITGFLDELRISESFVDNPFVQRFRRYAGSVTSRVFDLEYTNSILHRIEVDYESPGNTAVSFYYRIGDALDSISEVAAQWRPYNPETGIETDRRGRYLQLRAELLPDGSGMNTPVVHSISFYYEPDLPPHPPERITAKPGFENVSLSWSRSLDQDIAGYLVYYGDRPGVYFGDDSDTGASPVDVGNVSSVTLEGLENGKLYYFSIVAYDNNDPPHESAFSREVASRPSSIYRRR